MTALPNLMPIVPELLIACSAMALLLLGVFRGEGSAASVSWLAVLVLGLAGIMLFFLDGERITTFGGQFVMDSFA